MAWPGDPLRQIQALKIDRHRQGGDLAFADRAIHYAWTMNSIQPG